MNPVGTSLAATTGSAVADAVLEDPAHLGVALVETAIEGCQAAQALAPCNLARSVRVDTWLSECRGVEPQP